jgi:glycosyltransferase involved in cell wall biosynthesis/predicted metal-dependent phosphoesterase TrpH
MIQRLDSVTGPLPPVATPGGDPSRPRRTVRVDLHCHSKASSKPVMKALGLVDMPECYSEPEQVFDQARARGMDYVTITDHDSIVGAMHLVERGFDNVIIGEEVTVHFPEDRCKLHVLVWGLTPQLHEEIEVLGLRDDVYDFAEWLEENALPHSLAHPLYVQNGRLTAWHLERCALLFKGWETLNGAHAGTHRSVVERYLGVLTPRRVQDLVKRHQIEPKWTRIWHKAVTAGSDDHGLLNIGRTFTCLELEPGEAMPAPAALLRRIMAGHATVGGEAGHASLLAHQLATVGANFYARRMLKGRDARHRYIASKLLRFAGVDSPKPTKASLLLNEAKRRVMRVKGSKKSLPVVNALRDNLAPVLEKFPDLRERLDPGTWSDGAAIAQHERMAEFIDELSSAMNAAMASGAIKALKAGDKTGIVDHLLSYALVQLAQAPYLFSLFHQNKERTMLERLEHEAAEPGSGVSVLERPMRVSLFTDTLGDVNGVCRFIQNVAAQALTTGRDLQVITCTKFPTPSWDNIYNFEPVFATKMPKYEQLELVLPPLMKIMRHVEKHRPDVMHISTPGPVGMIGYLAAKMMKVPVLGVYHTDFPAYIDHLFDDHAYTAICSGFMRFFYKPFRNVFTRSADYVDALADLGIAREKIVRLMPGIETARFNTGYRDEAIWKRLEANPGAAPAPLAGIGRPSVKVLYVGRVSIEKNLPMLAEVWKRVSDRCRREGLDAELVVVGDGPYRPVMQEALAGRGVSFLGFRHGDELSSIYATSDMFVFPSVTDTLGQVVMESQASGMPVLVTDQGGPKEVVDHGRTGFVISADDHAAWADTIVELIRDTHRRQSMGRAAAEAMKPYDILHSFEHFWEVHTQAWHEHLATLGITPKSAGQRSETLRPAREPAVVGA